MRKDSLLRQLLKLKENADKNSIVGTWFLANMLISVKFFQTVVAYIVFFIIRWWRLIRRLCFVIIVLWWRLIIRWWRLVIRWRGFDFIVVVVWVVFVIVVSSWAETLPTVPNVKNNPKTSAAITFVIFILLLLIAFYFALASKRNMTVNFLKIKFFIERFFCFSKNTFSSRPNIL